VGTGRVEQHVGNGHRADDQRHVEEGLGCADIGPEDGKSQRGQQQCLDQLRHTHDHRARISRFGWPRNDALGNFRQRDRSAPRSALRGNVIEYGLLGIEAEHFRGASWLFYWPRTYSFRNENSVKSRG
jgi:hypothetical protein